MSDVCIDKKGRRIQVVSDAPLPGLRTLVPGAYETASGYWTVPLSIESCRLLWDKYRERLVLGPELQRWGRTVLDSRSSMAELSGASDAVLERLPTVAPKLATVMEKRKYQKVGARFVADNPATLIADDPGLGKTLIAMGGILEAGTPGPYLVVAPKVAADTVWQREIGRWLGDRHRAVILPELRYQREQTIRLTRYTPYTWLIVHPEIVMVASWWICPQCNKKTVEGNQQQRKLACGHSRPAKTKKLIKPNYPRLFEVEWGAVIVDESHESLIRRKGKPTQRRRGLDMLKVRADGIRLAMSGTPIDAKPHQLWGTLNWLDPVQYSAFHRWAELYWQKGGYTGFDIGEFRQDRECMLWDSMSAIALRRTKAEVAKDLPPKIYVGSPLIKGDEKSPVGIWLEMEGKQEKAYRQIEEMSVAHLDSGRLEAITSLAELTRLKQLACAYGDIEKRVVKVRCASRNLQPCRECAMFGAHRELKHYYRPELPSNKFNWTVEALEEWGYPSSPITKVVIVSFYTGILERFRTGLEEHFKTGKSRRKRSLCTAITGRTPNNQRRTIIDEFNKVDNGPQIMLLNVKAGGTAITLDTADRMIFLSETRNPDQQLQAEDRIHRISNPRTCMYYYLRSLGTVDVGIALANQEDHAATHRLLDGRRGVEYFRHVMELSRHRP